VKARVIREYVGERERPRPRWKREERRGAAEGEGRPPTRALTVRKQGRRLLKARSQSLSMDKLTDARSEEQAGRARLGKAKHTYYSTERLPTLSREEEERIIRLRKYEDDTEKLNEKAAAQQRGLKVLSLD
jgi:hypothetical protein